MTLRGVIINPSLSLKENGMLCDLLCSRALHVLAFFIARRSFHNTSELRNGDNRIDHINNCAHSKWIFVLMCWPCTAYVYTSLFICPCVGLTS